VKPYKKKATKIYRKLLERVDTLPCDDIMSIITGNGPSAFTWIRRNLESEGYKFESNRRTKILRNGGRQVSEWRVVRRPNNVKPKMPDQETISNDFVEGIVDKVLRRIETRLANQEK
jgi:hypothetical protein